MYVQYVIPPPWSINKDGMISYQGRPFPQPRPCLLLLRDDATLTNFSVTYKDLFGAAGHTQRKF